MQRFVSGYQLCHQISGRNSTDIEFLITQSSIIVILVEIKPTRWASPIKTVTLVNQQHADTTTPIIKFAIMHTGEIILDNLLDNLIPRQVALRLRRKLTSKIPNARIPIP